MITSSLRILNDKLKIATINIIVIKRNNNGNNNNNNDNNNNDDNNYSNDNDNDNNNNNNNNNNKIECKKKTSWNCIRTSINRLSRCLTIKSWMANSILSLLKHLITHNLCKGVMLSSPVNGAGKGILWG